MIIWLASYPKSGNTLVRSLLSAYFFSKDGNYDFHQIKNIQQFPRIEYFKNLGIDINNENEIIKNYINVQKNLNKKKSLQFFKTHSALFNINNNAFTDLNNSLGVIYIVRDPRNIVTSWAHHNNLSIQDSSDYMIFQKEGSGNINKIYHGTWNFNYNSWKSFKYQNRYLLVKYEDLIFNKKSVFLKILKFIERFQKKKNLIKMPKVDNIIKSTTFEKMKHLENQKGFFEAMKDKETRKNKPFFNLGPNNKWQNLLEDKIRNKIEKAFNHEMKELGYI
tara:strand:- start:33 stop:863 length:831 start_codon:yes stop_codon:yes gene_type:complete